ncbi:MAG: hypothetical protein AAGA56_06420 [Myxococcota bacterium]
MVRAILFQGQRMNCFSYLAAGWRPRTGREHLLRGAHVQPFPQPKVSPTHKVDPNGLVRRL